MGTALQIAVVGVGRIGVFHAQHVQELGRETGTCQLVAVVDTHGDTAERVARQLQAGQEREIRPFTRVADLAESELADSAVIASRTADHEYDAKTLIDAGQRVLIEKPLTDSLESAQAFADYLDSDTRRRTALMLAFMRRFDEPLMRAREMLQQQRLGRIFKVTSILEDPLPPPDGYQSPGLLTDMAVHNVDEIMWLTGEVPTSVTGTGARLYNQKISSVREDFDDAFLQMWMREDLVGQVQVSRNHVAGYRNETWVFGEEGTLHVGHFQENPLKVSLEAFDRRGLIERRDFEMRDYGREVPVFIERFGPAYKRELAHFATQCQSGAPFAVDHSHGLAAMRVVADGAAALQTAGEV